ncbi:unnamed protein product [Rhodiola kirilowii]
MRGFLQMNMNGNVLNFFQLLFWQKCLPEKIKQRSVNLCFVHSCYAFRWMTVYAWMRALMSLLSFVGLVKLLLNGHPCLVFLCFT